MGSYARPSTLAEALNLMAPGDKRLLAGGTDLYPGAGTALSGDILDLTAVAGLSGLEPTAEGGVRIGACTTWTAIAEADLPPAFDALRAAARQVGGRQIQNAGTIGGNLCNASPAADGVPPLLALDARAELVSPRGTRLLPLADFITGPRKVALDRDEALAAVLIPAPALAGRSAFVKLGARAYLVISIAMVAARIVTEAGRVREAAVAVGACSAVARRLPAVEAALQGARPAEAAERIVPADVAAALAPIDDVRASAAYRAGAATELVRRAVTEALA
ncbi:MAG: FAD binding domain-containing protein [Rhodobacteraceae bacterium]|nr:FAD binding domain-containing protein [Paracoccaceae bacterium]